MDIDIAGILGILGFVLAGILAYLEWHRYYIPLHLRVRELQVHRSPDGIHFLVLLRVCFVNPAARGKTVGYIQVGKPDNATVAQPPYEYEKGHNTLRYWIPNNHVESYLSVDEILVLPLDIPPHQSQSKWYALLFQMNEAIRDFDIPTVQLLVLAEDIWGKTIAKYNEEVELKTHTLH